MEAGTLHFSLTVEQRAKIVRIIKRLADIGRIYNRTQFKKIEDDFFEFKYFQIRMPCFFKPSQRVIITHGFIKKGDNIGSSETSRMKRIREEHNRRKQKGVE